MYDVKGAYNIRTEREYNIYNECMIAYKVRLNYIQYRTSDIVHLT